MIQMLYRGGGGRPCVAIQHATRLRYDAQHPATRRRRATTRTAAHATRRAAGACVAIQILYRDWEKACDTAACDRYMDSACCGTTCDMVGLDHDTASVRAMTRSSERCDTALCARPERSAQPGPWVCPLCTRPSFDSMHCSESLFGSLFMNTVHGHSSRSFQKIK